MNCREFAKIMGDYVNRTLCEDVAGCAQSHLDACAECASKVHELEQTAVLVRSLDRASTPPGFEARLRQRLAAQRARPSAARLHVIADWLRGLGQHRLALRPALAGLLLCVLIAGSLFMLGPGRNPGASDTDSAYLTTCRAQHARFDGTNPLGDESAAALRERAGDLGGSL